MVCTKKYGSNTFRALVPFYLSGESVRGRERAAVTRHLKKCPDCQWVRDEYQRWLLEKETAGLELKAGWPPTKVVVDRCE